MSQLSFQVIAGAILLTWNLNEWRLKMNHIVTGWHPEGCNNFLRDTYYV